MPSGGKGLIEAWLLGRTGDRLVRKCGRRLKSEFANRERFATEEDLLQELRLFILEHARLWPVLLQSPSCGRFLETAFRNHLRNATRKADRPSSAYLKRRVSDLLLDDPDFGTDTGRGPQRAFAWLDALQSPLVLLTPEDLGGIPYPGGLPMWIEAVAKREVLMPLIRHFWQEVCRIWGEPVRVRIDDFLTWLGRHVSMPARTDLTRCTNDGEEATADPFEQVADPQTPGFRPGPEDLSRWAGQVAERFSPEEAQTLLLSCREKMKLERIAKALRGSGASTAHVWKKAAIWKIKSFLCDLPCMGPDDCDEALLDLFWECLLTRLEKRLPAPYDESGSNEPPSRRKRP
jgi:DNA-directed RNA polymerase specialized sigma24 family protein